MKKILLLSFLKRSNKKTMPNLMSGFTLIEALVAISILMIAIASPMTLAQKGLSTATLSKDQMIASFLAQDAIEAVKNIRDQIAVSDLTPADWLYGNGLNGSGPSLTNCICNDVDKICNFDSATPSYCTIDTTSSVWDSNSIKSNNQNLGVLKIFSDTDGKFLRYGYISGDATDGPDSRFARYINIKRSDSNSNEAAVNVRVSWDSPQGLQKIDIQDFIYNYSENL